MLEDLATSLQIYSWWDLIATVLDFGIVYFVIYQILLLIRGTRAVQMLVGLLLIIVGYFVTQDDGLGLSTIHWLLDKFIGSFILVVVVLFQQDIKRGLATLARSRVFSGLSSGQEAQLVEELVRASSMLSERRIGALIVIERSADLSPFAEEGVKVDAMVSKETLFAIFNPANANPLHDGAVIVRDARVLAAGVFLPLTSNPRVDKRLGTRHRAGIGLSEDTDAAVLIVSEETGQVSIALAGNLQRGIGTNSLRELLQELLGVRTEERRAGRETRAGA